ncbi:hypothetical protein HED51_24495 [Ochrobactrum grignonense]|nr:hypothetical protein [Brucella grignonensis]
MNAFADQPLGAVVSLTPDAPYRISEVQTGAALSLGRDSERDEYYLRILKALEINGDPASEVTRLNAVASPSP